MNQHTPDLVICIPTYNRTLQLKRLFEVFINQLLERYESRLHVFIADNSDMASQQINLTIVGNLNRVSYHANAFNLGYGGNIVTLLQQASQLGRYLWFCSDDDEINIDAFHVFMDLLQADREHDIALYAFSFVYKGCPKQNPKMARCFSKEDYGCFDHIIRHNKVIPFLLLSSYAIKTKYLTPHVLCKMRDYANDFAHISLLGIALSQDAPICNSGLPLIIYNTEGSPGIEISKTFKGYVESLDCFPFLTAKDKLTMSKTFLRGMLYLVLGFRSDPRPDVQKVFSPFTSSYAQLVKYLINYPTFRGVVIALAAFLPAPLIVALLSLNKFRSQITTFPTKEK
jgi:glycosyltransferase involved in cell wall biosynthesis